MDDIVACPPCDRVLCEAIGECDKEGSFLDDAVVVCQA
jgi:hypothetical protein